MLQATVQAALGALPLDQVRKVYPVGSPQHAQYMGYAMDTLTASVFEVGPMAGPTPGSICPWEPCLPPSHPLEKWVFFLMGDGLLESFLLEVQHAVG
jgi:hypothetical protein